MKTLETTRFLDLTRQSMDAVEHRMRSQDGFEHHPDLIQALEHLLTAGGKRIRPRLVLLAAEITGADKDAAITLAAAIEMLHTATLVHDDLIDGSLLRRGNPTLNAQWTAGATVLTGDYIFARAAHLASLTQSISLMKQFALTLMTIVNGEATQLFSREDQFSYDGYLRRIYAKTAALFEISAEGTALLPEGNVDFQIPLRAFGYNLGIAFQVTDDILDFTGDPEKLGKPVANDLRQGLITLPTLLYLEHNHADRKLAHEIQHRQLSEDDILDLFASIRESNAIKNSQEKADHYLDLAEQDLGQFPESSARTALHDLIGSLRHRRT